VTKKEIVKSISERANLTQLKTKEIVQWTFDAIIETLVTEGRIELRNFGVFEVRQRKARKARNPRTGEAVEVQPKNVVNFQPGKEMEIEVRKAKVASKKRKSRKPAAEPVGAAAGGGGGSLSDLDTEPMIESSNAESADADPLKPR
jgi:integration host factor subunit beta